MDQSDAAWLAGLFEGEGCFRITRTKGAEATISMTDLDVIQRVSRLMSPVKIRTIPPIGGRHKPQYVWSVSNEAQVRDFIALISPWLGTRRSEKAQQVLDHLDIRPSLRRHFNRSKTHCKRGHPYDAANTYISAKGSRSCRICRRDAARASYARRPGASGRR